MNGDTVTTIVVIFLAGILIFIFPLMTVADRNDDIAHQLLISETERFTQEIATTGTLTNDMLDAYVKKISSSKNYYIVDFDCQIFDDNPTKKVTQVDSTKIGEGASYHIYTASIDKTLEGEGVKYFKKGDIVTVKVYNSNKTLPQILRGIFYGNDEEAGNLATQATATVTKDGGK